MLHSCTKFSIFVRSLVNGVGLLILYSFRGVGFIVVISVNVENGFMVANGLSFYMGLEELGKLMCTMLFAMLYMVRARLSSVWLHLELLLFS